MEDGFNKHKDTAGLKHTEDALDLWTDMLLEELEHDDKCLRLISRFPRVPLKS